MSKQSIFKELKQGLQEMKAERQGKITLKTTEVDMPAPIAMPKTRIAAIRKSHNLSQPVFARMLATNVATLRNWEQGRSEPNAQAKLLLKMVETDSTVLERMVELTTTKIVRKARSKQNSSPKKAAAGRTAKRKRSGAAA